MGAKETEFVYYLIGEQRREKINDSK